MKTKDLPVFKQKVLDMLPVLQVDMWKKLDIDSREGSYIVNIMLEEHLLTRRRKDGSFLLEKLNGNSNGNITDFNKETEDDIKKKKAESDAKKKKAETDLRKKEKADLKKKTDVDIMKKSEADLKKKTDVDIMKKSEADLKKKTDVDIVKKSEADLKKKTDVDIKKEIDFATTTKDKNILNIKTKDINALKQEVLDILPILQADVWKRLDACDCNYLELIDLMVKENLITRTKLGKFFLLEAANGDKHKHETKSDVPTISSVKQVQKKKPKDTDDLKKLILRMLPIAPSDLLEKLDVSSNVCSNAINAMIKENLITRTEKNGQFLLEKINKVLKKHETNRTAMLSSKKRFAPCCGCALECDAVECMLLMEWLLE